MNQTIPIILTAGPVPPGFTAADINQLMQAVATYISGAIRADITFIPQVVNDPGTFEGQLIFNIPQRVFKGWDAGTGMYLAVTEHQIGDIKNTFIGTDDLVHGWVILNGRAIAAIPGITGPQQQALESIFGVGGSLPTVSPANVSSLPVGNAFGSIPWPAILPPAGTFTALPFSNPVIDTEGRALADDTEILRNTSEDIFTLIKQIQAVCQQMLTALNTNTAPPIWASVFCGYPGP